ncbi:glucans biosynthesis glucosyltransferase MdoH [Rhodoplanes sp. TEM]|uniref:Glucans biosynthesis glucosyltransferase H n=1 Tax=Rhodoplanes tepidamans TaxID=200616 RepID=A0ABT5J389_RHOTP|nr:MULTISPECIES: glucans biosynthesis glucosyltransferase MdoH [Rhodoplanes]MDC7784136.1 glucans biosynthesis glucosyltransferase MdoH [Rhodoplanes tepidamans]MDC7983231.1 glucans biosynthesis glucosyltransferase MdoH [Rhodoplanes sp. TEM]MDQ0356766.1 membrane glycosyltransferase [Rhodoplanes tepidamans]
MHDAVAIRPEPPRPSLPPERPLAMPEQSLWRPAGAAAPRPERPPRTWLRRLVVFGGTALLTAGAAHEMYQVLQVQGLTPPEATVLGLFVSLFAWIAFSLVSSVVGFVAILAGPDRTLGIDTAAALPELTTRTAVLLPTYNEDPHRVMSRLQAIFESIAETGRLAHFDVFVLSDTTDPDVWIREEAAFLALLGRTGADNIYYRHRRENVARKAGNIAEWTTRFGGAYAHMLVLDADSLMTGDTVVRLAAAMERHRSAGLIQTFPVVLNGTTLFARIQQFAGRVYGPLIARGIAWWHGAESNYWGHNAIIRVEAFAGQAGLPLLKGRKPFGGHILSHDFVEAALMRRAGWGVHMAPSLGGSFEECPPSLTEYAIRDRRWCQGNLQHLGVLPARGLHWVSRLHLLTGIGSYITSPLWLVFLLVGLLIALQAQFVKPEYFPSGFSLFPQWPAQDPVRAAWVFAGTMGILVVPKLLGWIAAMARTSERRGTGGVVRSFVSVVLETFVTSLIAPIMMLLQSRAVGEILLGRDAGWQAQQRDAAHAGFGLLTRLYGWHVVLGLLLGGAAYAVSAPLLLWMTPVVVGLVLAIPTVAVTSSERVGRGLRRIGLLLIPEERDPPAVLVRAQELAAAPADPEAPALLRLAANPALLEAHLALLEDKPARRKGDVEVPLVVALARVADADTLAEAATLLTPKETFSILADRRALAEAMRTPRG